MDWYCNEYAVVIIGIDGNNLTINDPYTEKEITMTGRLSR